MPSGVRPKGSGSGSRSLPVTPMSERQQMALLMQMTSGGNESGSRSPSSGFSRSRDRNERGWTPLHEACNHGWYEVAFRLVQSGANVNARGLDNDTPLHDAATNGHIKLVKLLVERGADIHAKNSKGKTPLDVAPAAVKPYLLNSNLPLQESTATSSRLPPRSRDDKKVAACDSGVSAGGASGGGSSKQQPKDEPMDAKGASTASATGSSAGSTGGDDVYEFKSMKESMVEEGERKGAEGEMDVDKKSADSNASASTDPLSIPGQSQLSDDATSSCTTAKRTFADTNDAPEEASGSGTSSTSGNDDESRRKKRKEETGKEGKSSAQRNAGQNKGQGNKQSSGGQNKSSGSVSAKGSGDKKSPCTSPKPNISDVENDEGKADLKVPPLKIVIPQTTSNEQETGVGRNGKTGSQRAHQALPYVVASSSSSSSSSSDSNDKDQAAPVVNSPENSTAGGKGDDGKKESGSASSEEVQQNDTESSTSASTPSTNANAPAAPVELHPRKRKMKQSKTEQGTAGQPEAVETPAEAQVHPHEQPITNCYQLFLNIRSQINKRRRGLFPVQPKPPQGFKDYLMNRCTYVLAGTAPTLPNITYPQSLPPTLKELFTEQEKERYRLRTQHVIEKEKLVLSVEQEILRVHGRAARALANQSLPFSVCTILRDEEVYNLITPEQEEKDRNARSRYNGRLFLSWLQDVDDKWEKIKEHMLLRHHNEAESLHAVQKMDWEWKMKELSLCDRKTTPKIDETHVPMVHVSDDFDLLPA